MTFPRRLKPDRPDSRPNIIFILTDQQHAGMMSCTGNRYLRTPAMNRLAASGTRFEKAYTSNPVCVPARFSLMTGRMPSTAGIRKNPSQADYDRLSLPMLGDLFQSAGYETVYGGKLHLHMPLEQTGFSWLTYDARQKLADTCIEFLKQPHRKPFLMVASFINPHDICYMPINYYQRKHQREIYTNIDSCTLEALIKEPSKNLEGFVKNCPPLPDNFEIPELEPECITEKYTKDLPFREYVRREWSPEMWRLYRWAYCRLTEMADVHIGRLLDAVRDAGLEENTLIVFTSDHGDLDSSHRLEHKSILYEEAVRIPFIMSYKGVILAGAVDETHLISNGLDLLPTLCDYAGIEAPQDLLGRSVRPIAEGNRAVPWRDSVVVESQDGRMVRTRRFKYNVYNSGSFREQLMDLEADPGEMNNLAYDPAYRDVLRRHQVLLREWMKINRDRFALEFVID